MASQYPVQNDTDLTLLKKLVNNSALLADEEIGDVASIAGTANQIMVSNPTGVVTLSLATTLVGINSITSVAGQNLELGVGTGGTVLTLTDTTKVATFAGQIAAASASAHTLGPVTFTNGVVTALTSIAAPTGTALTLTGGDTGASLSLGALSGGNASVTITPKGTGGVGIGTTASRKLHIASGASGIDGLLVEAIGGSSQPSVELKDYAGTPNRWGFIMGVDAVNDGNLNIRDMRQDVARMVFTTTGNVLIGGTTDITGSGGLKVFGTTASTSTTTGSLINAGGFGNAGAIFGGSNLSLTAATSTITLGSTNTGSIAVDANGALTVTPKANQNLTIATGAGGIVSSGSGTSSFAGLLKVEKASGASTVQLGAGANNADYGRLEFHGNTSGSAVSLGYIPIYNKRSGSAVLVGALEYAHEGAAADEKTYLSVSTHDGSSNAERLRISSAGSLTVSGTGTHTFGTTNTVTLSAGDVTTNNTSLGTGFTVNSGGTAYGSMLTSTGALRFNASGTNDFIWTKAGPTTLMTLSNAGNLTVSGTGTHAFGTTAGGIISLPSTTGAAATGGLLFGADTNLYRSAANTLATDDSLVVSGASGITSPKYTIGTSGPDVASSLAARGPRQGLVGDGTTVAVGTVSLPAFGASGWSVSAVVTINTAKTYNGIFGATDDGGPWIFADASNTLDVGIKPSLVSFASFFTTGKPTRVTITNDGTTLRVYRNGVEFGTSTSANVIGNYTAGITRVGNSTATSDPMNGTIMAPTVWNRALTAAEVLSLYESGAPSGSDYPSQVAGTALITGDDSTFASDTGFWTKSGATIGGGVCSFASGGEFIRRSVLVIGSRYRLTFDVTLGTAASLNANNAVVNYLVASTSGSKSVEFVASDNTNLDFTAIGGTATLDNVTLTPLGLLLAPDALEPGVGYQWHDQSGNGAHIILPASGVTWALPSSQGNFIAGTTNTSGNQQLCAASTLLPASVRITSIQARSRSGTPTITIGTASGGSQLVSSVALSTTWKNLTVALSDGVVTTADDVWVGSDSTDVVETRINYDCLSF